MVDYIVKKQNHFVYASLFHHNLVEMMNKGVQVAALFTSKILFRQFDYDNWPAISANHDKIIAPFNNSIFKLRYHYSNVFRKLWEHEQDREEQELKSGSESEEGKKLMIVYKINFLPSLSDEDGTLMEAIANSTELEIFETDAVKDLLDYKWSAYASSIHILGFLFHLSYILELLQYLNITFLWDWDPVLNADRDDIIDVRPHTMYLWVICVLLLYPLGYDGNQLYKQGRLYWNDPWNYVDILNIGLGYANVGLQLWSPWAFGSKLCYIFVLLICLIKLFFFLRIFMALSQIVTMMKAVVLDLQVFLLFFFTLICMGSLAFDVLAANNAPEYRKIGPFLGQIIYVLRLSLGDFHFAPFTGSERSAGQQNLFWLAWFIMVVLCSLVFLNFIIAEVCNSYQTVKDNIDSLIYKERAGLISEAEDIMTANAKRHKYKFPKYLITREVDI